MGATSRDLRTEGAAARRNYLDALAVVAAVVAVALPFIAKLGFYSDDWALLSDFQKDLTAGKFGVATLLRGYEPRPLQGIQLGLQFYALGLRPLPHHVVNTAILAAALASLYLLLARMRVRRDIALAACFIFAVLPQLSTARVWYSTFQIPTALLLALLSLHAQLSFTRTGRWLWLPAAAVAALASMAAYEIFAPLVFGFPFWLILSSRMPGGARIDRRRALILAVAALCVVLLAVVAKFMLTDRAQSPDLGRYLKGLKRLVEPAYDWRTEGSLNLFATLEVNFWQPFVGMARATEAVLRGQLGPGAILAGVAVAALALWRLAAVPDGERNGGGSVAALCLGVCVFVIAHTPFLVTAAIMFAPTGICNRTQVAMAIGVAMVIAGAIAWIAARVSPAQRRLFFAIPVCLILAMATWRTEQILSYWAEGWSMEQRIIASAQRDLAAIPPHSKVMFDGVCPYHGPAIILETWEAEGMLTLALGRPIRGDTSTDNMRITDEGLTTHIYDDNPLYPYGADLFAYDPYRHLVVPLPDRAAAERYFASPGRRHECPLGYLCQGQLI